MLLMLLLLLLLLLVAVIQGEDGDDRGQGNIRHDSTAPPSAGGAVLPAIPVPAARAIQRVRAGVIGRRDCCTFDQLHYRVRVVQ